MIASFLLSGCGAGTTQSAGTTKSTAPTAANKNLGKPEPVCVPISTPSANEALPIITAQNIQQLTPIRQWNVGDVSGIQFMHNGDLILTQGKQHFELWDLNTQQQLVEFFPGNEINENNGYMPLSDDDPMIAYEAYAINDKILFYRYYPNFAYFVWDLCTRKKISAGETSPLYPMNVSLSPDGKTIAYSTDYAIHFIDVKSNRERLVIPITEGIFFDASNFNSSSNEYISIEQDRDPPSIVVYDTTTGDIIRTYDISSVGIGENLYSLEDQVTITSSRQEGFSLSKFDGTTLANFELFPSTIDDLMYTLQDSSEYGWWDYYGPFFHLYLRNNLFVGTITIKDMSRLRIWDTNTGLIIRELEISSAFDSYAICPDGKTLYTISDGAIYVWQIVDNE